MSGSAKKAFRGCLFFTTALLMITALSFDSKAASENGNVAAGKKLFEEKCAACHAIGGEKKVGPDLKGITEKRPEGWLIGFITNPEKMFEEGDPTATQLLKEYGGLKMPDSGVSEEQAKDILAYIKSAGDTSQKSDAEGSAEKSERDPGSADTASAEKGKEIFNNQCSICHTIGGGKKIGPDMKGVTERRPREWLVKYISNPEKMFEEGDPIAKKLMEESGGVKMPNLGLSEEQVSDVLAYIKSQSGPGEGSAKKSESSGEAPSEKGKEE